MVDDAYSRQMLIRENLIDQRFADVHALLDEGEAAAKECLEEVLTLLADNPAYTKNVGSIVRPDGKEITIDRDNPLVTLGRLIQEDICILQPSELGHKLVGAILCFPASWTLAEKIGRPMVRIHAPVTEYSGEVAKRVQRLFDMVHSDRPMWRANAFAYDHARLFTPRREDDPPRKVDGEIRFVRSERQVIKKLPQTGAIVFSIHTFIVPIENLTHDQAESFDLVLEKSGRI